MSEDQGFIRSLFGIIRADLFAHLPLPEEQKEALLDMQFRAQATQYDARYPEAKNEILLLDERTIGILRTDEGSENWTLIEIALLSEFRGQGIGGSILQHLSDQADHAGKSLHLTVEKENPARRLYGRLGFQEIGNDGVYVSMVKECSLRR